MDTTKYENKADKEINSKIVEIVVVKDNNGIKKGETKKVLVNSEATQYMISNGYWKINK